MNGNARMSVIIVLPLTFIVGALLQARFSAFVLVPIGFLTFVLIAVFSIICGSGILVSVLTAAFGLCSLQLGYVIELVWHQKPSHSTSLYRSHRSFLYRLWSLYSHDTAPLRNSERVSLSHWPLITRSSNGVGGANIDGHNNSCPKKR